MTDAIRERDAAARWDALSRRDALRGLAVCGLAAPATAASIGGAATKSARAVALFDFAIAGGHHHGLPEALLRLEAGVRLRLRREPDNPHDADAVAVLLDGHRIGYVPRSANTMLARLLDDGACVCATVRRPLDRDDACGERATFAFTSFAAGDPLVGLTLENESHRLERQRSSRFTAANGRSEDAE